MERKVLLGTTIIMTVLFSIAAGLAIYFWRQNVELTLRISDPTREAKQLLVQIGRLIELPEGEEPTVATVTDADKLKEQPFFQRAKNGDRVVMYTKAGLAIIFDDKANKIVNVGAINVKNTEATPSSGQLENTDVPTSDK